jgi:tetratricopeptide (TPR) repeat protein
MPRVASAFRQTAAQVTTAMLSGMMLPSMIRTAPYSLLLVSWLALAAGVPAARAADTPPPAAPGADTAPPAATTERDAAYQAFRRDFDAGRFTEALPHAERVVTLTEELDAHHPDLARALNNLGATQYQLRDYGAAEKAYSRALTIIEESHGALSPQLIGPLRGLALTYQGTGRSEAAVPLLERAVSIARRSHGLFDPGQKELLTPLADGYVALARWKDADRVQQYALQISEHEYGLKDPRLFQALQQLGRWYTSTGRRNAARQVWERLRTIMADPAHPDSVGQIVALRGIAETYRLDYQYGSEPIEAPFPGEGAMHRDPLETDAARHSASMLSQEYVLNSAGQEALDRALALAEHLQSSSTLPRAIVLVDLGDWQLIAGRPDRALPFYNRALPLLPAQSGSAESSEGPLSRATALLYRAPPASLRLREQPQALVTEKYAIAEFTVTEDGRVRDAKIVEGDATDSQRSALLSAISHATYRPRFVDGKPVVTEKVRYRETFRQLKN